MLEIFPVDMVDTHKAPVSLYDYGKLFAARAAVALRSCAGLGFCDIVISALGTVDAVHRLVWNGGCHF